MTTTAIIHPPSVGGLDDAAYAKYLEREFFAGPGQKPGDREVRLVGRTSFSLTVTIRSRNLDSPNGPVSDGKYGMYLECEFARRPGLLIRDRKAFLAWRAEWRTKLAAIEAEVRANRRDRKSQDDDIRREADAQAQGLRERAADMLARLHVLRDCLSQAARAGAFG